MTHPSERKGEAEPVLGLLRAQARQAPLAIAVTCGAETLTFASLFERARALAACLREAGTATGAFVGVCLTRSANLAVAILGVLEAGCTWVPLDPSQPRARNEFVLRDTHAAALVTDEPTAAAASFQVAQTIVLDRQSNPVRRPSGPVPAPATHRSADLAYVMYTSGSSGRPKGVLIGRDNLDWYLKSMRRRLDISPGDVYLHTASIAFSSSVRQLLLPLSSGASVAIAEPADIHDPRSLFRLIKERQVTVLDIVPSYWRASLHVLEGLDQAERRELFRNDLRLLLSASEPLPADLVRGWRQRFEHPARLINMFGQTETTGIVTTYEIPVDGVGTEGMVVPLGTPLDGARVHLMDASGQPAEGGVAEICIASPGVGRGYLNQPELTSKQFRPDPFSDDSTRRLYRTGDMGRLRADGVLEFAGRVDQQVKVRGVRVELPEIEMALAAHPCVAEAAVAARSELGQTRLVAFVALRDPDHGDTVRAWLAARLPAAMLPHAFVPLESLPRLPSGKLDRQALLSLPLDTMRRASPLAGLSEMERRVAALWTAALRVPDIAATDNYFDLGGDSLTGLQLLADIERIFGKRLPLATLYQHPTLRELAAVIDQTPGGPVRSLVTLRGEGSRRPFFWVHGEVSDAFLAQHLGDDQPVYGLDHQGQDGRPVAHRTVEEIAAYYLSEIRSVQSGGPYLLGGYCFGSLVAFEMARQLLSAGQAVPLLALLEPSPLRTCGTTRLTLARAAGTEETAGQHADVSAAMPGSRQSPRFLERMRTAGERAVHAVNDARCAMRHRLGRPLPPQLRSYYVSRLYSAAKSRYALAPYRGDVVVFVAASTPDRLVDWSALSEGRVSVHEVPGDHRSILRDPFATVWIGHLQAVLAGAHARIEGYAGVV